MTSYDRNDRDHPVTRSFEHRGITFTIGPKDIHATHGRGGLAWRIPQWNPFTGLRSGYTESGGAFYDDCPSHPASAWDWAEQSARLTIDRILDAP